jgi:hypothetical protein
MVSSAPMWQRTLSARKGSPPPSGAALDGRESRGALGHFLQGFVDVVVGDVQHRHFEIEIFVISELEFGENFKDGTELEGLAFGKIELIDLGLRNRSKFLLGDGFFDALGDEGLHNFTLDVVGEATANQGDRSFARTKAGNAGDAGEFLGDALHRFGDFFGGNLQVEFAAASGFGHTESFPRGTA